MIEVVRNERVVHLALSSPPVNVLDTAILGELSGHLRRLRGDEGVAAVVLSGSGRCFSAGASVAEHKQEKAEAMLSSLVDACTAVADFPAPVVALVHGPCLGGGLELASFCDFVVADPGATFGQPEIKLAFFPPLACYRLPRLTGLQNAAWAILTGDTLSAERAAAIGLVQKLLPRDRWGEMDELLNGLSAPVLRLAKQALSGATAAERTAELERLKRLFVDRLYELEDVAEGIASFEAKRRPSWQHR